MTYKERKQFVEDPMNWEVAGEMPGMRILELDYGGHAWYKAEILQATSNGFREWIEIRKFKYLPEANAFTAPISSAEIIEEIKRIDEEGRHIGKKK